MNNFFQRLSQLRVRTLVATILILTLLIAAGLFYLWIWAGKKMETIVTEQFNEQQLMLARKIADNVEVYLDFLEFQMVSYRHAYQVEAMTPPHFQEFLTLQTSYLKNFGILAIRQYDATGALVRIYGPEGMMTPRQSEPLAARYLSWAKETNHRDAVLLTEMFQWQDQTGAERRVMATLTPLFFKKGEPTAAGAQPEGLGGVLEVIIDPYYIAGMVTKDVRSGKTGYPWIIDRDAVFLAHYEKSFVGKNQTQVREERNP
jgi:hypothetical protein